MVLKEAGLDQPFAVCLPFRRQRTFAETADSMRRAFEDLRAAEDAIERQLADIRAQIDACRLPQTAPGTRAA